MRFSITRTAAVLFKEFTQMKRDRMTFGMIVGIPLIQLILFGFAINTNPKHLPTMVVSADHTPITRSIISAFQNSKYFKITHNNATEQQADEALANGSSTFTIQIPPNFSHDVVRGLRPSMLINADATDPTSTGQAISAANAIVNSVLNDTAQHGLPYLKNQAPPFNIVVHAKYNPDSITAYNIVPGLMGVVLTMTLTMITALAITRERERGTMEMLLVTPLHPAEVMVGKILPYVILGYIQMAVIMLFSWLLFGVPFVGSMIALLVLALPFVIGNLAVGLFFSTIAQNQLQAMQMTVFFFLPSLLLSGFMFPFHGMPAWAQWIGSVLPLTHFLHIVRGIMLKGNGWFSLWPNVWPILIFTAVAVTLAVLRYRQHLD